MRRGGGGRRGALPLAGCSPVKEIKTGIGPMQRSLEALGAPYHESCPAVKWYLRGNKEPPGSGSM